MARWGIASGTGGAVRGEWAGVPSGMSPGGGGGQGERAGWIGWEGVEGIYRTGDNLFF